MAGDRRVRIDAELFEAAQEEGRGEQRSARQQLEHWARLGRAFSAHEPAVRDRIAAAVRGDLPLEALSPVEQSVVNREIGLAIQRQARASSFGRGLVREGVPAVVLDEHGAVVELPPGSRRA